MEGRAIENLTGPMMLKSVSSSAFSIGALDSSTGGGLTNVGLCSPILTVPVSVIVEIRNRFSRCWFPVCSDFSLSPSLSQRAQVCLSPRNGIRQFESLVTRADLEVGSTKETGDIPTRTTRTAA